MGGATQEDNKKNENNKNDKEENNQNYENNKGFWISTRATKHA